MDSTKYLEQFLKTHVLEPCVLCVDPLALPAFRGIWKQLLGRNDGNVRNIISLDDKTAFRGGDALCSDVETVRFIVCLITSVKGEQLFEDFRRSVNNPGVRFKVATSVPVPRQDQWEVVPFCIIPQTPTSFVLTCQPCFSPTAFQLNPSKSNAYELEVEEDLSIEYKTMMKRVALSLNQAVSSQLNLDVSDAVYSIGFGSRLLANTIHSNLLTSEESGQGMLLSGLRTKASLLIVDRTLDWRTPLNDSDHKPLQKLHDQLLIAQEASEIWPNLAQAILNGSLSVQEAVSLAFRASSSAGLALDSYALSTFQVFQNQLGFHGEAVLRALKEVSTAREDCVRNASEIVETTQTPSSTNLEGGMLEFGESYYSGLLRKILSGSASEPLPSHVVHAKKLDVAKVALNLFGSVFGGGDSQRLNKEVPLRQRTNLVVFFLGGYTDTEVTEITEMFETLSPNHKVFIGGTHQLGDQEETQLALWNAVKSEGVEKQGTQAGSKSISNLFA